MSRTAPQPLESNGWTDLYRAAFLEADQIRILLLIAEAERAIVERAQMLIRASGDHVQEEQDMDDALYALNALKSCLAMHGRLAEAG